ncbi:MAG: cupin domain-containing protein [Pseudomonadota bacterium]
MKLPAGQLLDALPGRSDAEAFQTLITSGQTRIERIVSYGHASAPGDWYDQSWDEFVLVVSGAAVLQVEGEGERELVPGSWIYLPRRTRHRVVSTDPHQPTVWLAVHVGEPVGG